MQAKQSLARERVAQVRNFLAQAQRDPMQRLLRRRAKVAGQLSALIATLGISHAKVAAKAGMKPPQLSKQLSGDTNLTLDSIGRICEAVGADYDLVFRKQGEQSVGQWWERAQEIVLQDLAESLRSHGEDQRQMWSRYISSIYGLNGTSGQMFDPTETKAANDEPQLIAA